MLRPTTLLFLLAACGGGAEGLNAGECADSADNDADGLFDCDDPDCTGSPDCDADATGTGPGPGTGGGSGPGTGGSSGTGTGTGTGGDTGWSGTGTGTGTGTATTFSISVIWTDDGSLPTDTDGDSIPDTGCGDRVDITIMDPLGIVNWNMGMAETGSVQGWFGEDCMGGAYGYNICHGISAPTDRLNQVSSCSVADIGAGSTTLFGANSDPFLTYYFDDNDFCFVFGDEVSYYASLGCAEMF